MAIITMTRHLDFDQFLREQNAEKAERGNLVDRKAQWLEKIQILYATVQEILFPYIERGAMGVRVSSMELREELLGSYEVPSLNIDLGNSSVRFVPVGTILLGSPGRVDLVGPHGNVRFVLTLPDADRPILVGSTASEGARPDKQPKPMDLAAYVWKVSTSPPLIRYSALDPEALQSAIMDVARGQSARR